MGIDLEDGRYYLASVDESRMMGLSMYLRYIVCIYREEEGLSVMIQEDIQEEIGAFSEHKLKGPYALIKGEGLGRAIGILEKKKIEVNLFSAYSHDYLFVPYGKRKDALNILG